MGIIFKPCDSLGVVFASRKSRQHLFSVARNSGDLFHDDVTEPFYVNTVPLQHNELLARMQMISPRRQLTVSLLKC